MGCTWKLRRLAIAIVSVFTHVHFGIRLNESQALHDSSTPYTIASLISNPYLGWQPIRGLSTGAPPSFSWRSCFKEIAPANKSDECLEYDIGEPPAVNESWIPDVTMLHKMARYGKDIHGNPFPPRLPPELCEDIPVGGGSTDANKKCFTESNIRPVVALDAEVPTPKVLCLIYTMAEAHSTRIRAIRDTWAGGCDGFLAFSTVSDPRLPAISLEHEGEESYDNMWQKVSLLSGAVSNLFYTCHSYRASYGCLLYVAICGKRSGAFGRSLGITISRTLIGSTLVETICS